MEIKNARFVISSSHVKDCPSHGLPEYAFIGRSNVGKSSLINMLTCKKGLAMTSSTPGKTMLINHFLSMIVGTWSICRVMDMPAETKRVERHCGNDRGVCALSQGNDLSFCPARLSAQTSKDRPRIHGMVG